MVKQLHKKFLTEQVKSLLERYLSKEIDIAYVLKILGIKRSKFFELLKEYRECPESFSISYKRTKSTRKISEAIEENIIKELHIEKNLIEDKNMPICTYNYSYIRDQL